MRSSLAILIAMLLLGPGRDLYAQAVSVTASLETNTLAVGDTTVLHIYAQVVPALRSNAERIFSWYVDVLHTNDAAVCANYSAMLKAASDNDSQTSSNGFDQGPNRRGIYDTFINLPGAGVNVPVELMRIPVSGRAAGRTQFSVAHGTGVPQLSQDFMVARDGGGTAMTGGDYSAAPVVLQVVDPPCTPQLAIAREGGQFRLNFTPCGGRDHYLEFQDNLDPQATWQRLPGGPHNSGSLLIGNDQMHRFFRLRAERRLGCDHAN
jgi:hypothetical protein